MGSSQALEIVRINLGMNPFNGRDGKLLTKIKIKRKLALQGWKTAAARGPSRSPQKSTALVSWTVNSFMEVILKVESSGL